ncbi:hypothetical protein ACFWH1_02570 [Streptomyces sp. NPDC127037]|uniref:hypothetical protein n=1 Tax=Streptomyces sp. NPDC127037 TaxID=3347113 RepID=UPI00365D6A68
MSTVPARTFLPLVESPLITAPQPIDEYADLAARLAATADGDAATVRSLLSLTHPDMADRVADVLDGRADLAPDALALLVAERPDLKGATGRLKAHLFPDVSGCHRFTRTVAALAYRPEAIDSDFLATERFTEAASAADPVALHGLLTPLLSAPSLAEPADAALGVLLTALRTTRPATSPLDLAADAARRRTRLTRIRTALVARREETLAELARHTAGLTLAASLWYDALTAAADTPEAAEEALRLAAGAASALSDGDGLDCDWPAVRARWQYVVAAAGNARSHPAVWDQAWAGAETTSDGSYWDPTQRALVAGHDLLVAHVRDRYSDHVTPPTPSWCWAAEPSGRALIHLIADHLTGHEGHSPLPHFDDAMLISFIQGLAKNRRTRVPGALHIHGLIAAVKAARSKTHFLARPGTENLGVVIPTRHEAHRIATAEDGENALASKVAQLAWLLEARPDARAEILLVDEDTDGASARAAAQVLVNHPQIRLTVSSRTEPGISTKGGAVLWGLAQLFGAGHTTLAYTDMDLTYPLDQLGLHLAALDRPGVAAVIGSRRLPDSHGYYPPAGPPATARLYQQAVHELLDLDVSDPQAGFKVFSAHALGSALPRVTDRRLSFDTELLAVLRRAGHTVAEVGIAALHRYVEGQAGTPRDYDEMLASVHQQSVRLGHDLGSRPTPVWRRIQAAGSLGAAAAKPAPVDVTLSFPPT